MKSGGYGGKILDWVRELGKKVVLEIEPLANEQAHRRWKFYQREQVHLTPYTFLQLPYRKELERIELLILSYPAPLGAADFAAFSEFIEERVIVYCEK